MEQPNTVELGTAPPPSYTMGEPFKVQPATNVITVSSVVFGPEPQRMTCPRCKNQILTQVDTAANMKTHLCALLLCAVGCCICAPCPYCNDSCLEKRHYCPACKMYLGKCDN